MSPFLTVDYTPPVAVSLSTDLPSNNIVLFRAGPEENFGRFRAGTCTFKAVLSKTTYY